MNAMGAIAPKIAPLVRLLSSPVDGEALAACRAIGRTLNAAGCDFHDLAEVVERAALPVTVDQPCQEGSPAPEPNAKPWHELARDCLRRGASRLSDAEMDFLRSMATWPSKPSGKQARWLDAIAAALGIEATA